MRFMVGGGVYEARYEGEFGEWERECVLRVLGAPLNRFAYELLKSAVLFDVPSRVPEGFAVVGGCIRRGVGSIVGRRGDYIVFSMRVVESAPIYMPEPVYGPFSIEFHAETRDYSGPVAVAIDGYKLLGILLAPPGARLVP